MKEEIKIGDRLLVKRLFSSAFHATVIDIKKGLFGKYYICQWTAHDWDYGESYEVAGIIRSWNILCKN